MSCRCEDFISLVAHALVRAAATLVSTPGGTSHWLRLGCSVGQALSPALSPANSARTPPLNRTSTASSWPTRCWDTGGAADRRRGARNRRSLCRCSRSAWRGPQGRALRERAGLEIGRAHV